MSSEAYWHANSSGSVSSKDGSKQIFCRPFVSLENFQLKGLFATRVVLWQTTWEGRCPGTAETLLTMSYASNCFLENSQHLSLCGAKNKEAVKRYKPHEVAVLYNWPNYILTEPDLHWKTHFSHQHSFSGCILLHLLFNIVPSIYLSLVFLTGLKQSPPCWAIVPFKNKPDIRVQNTKATPSKSLRVRLGHPAIWRTDS